MDAAKHSEQQSPTPLGSEWFNNNVTVFLPTDVHQKVTREALHQDEVVFEHRGLKVVAAPWAYALCSKMDYLRRPELNRPHDLSDAIAYLHSHIQKHGGSVSLA